MATTTPISEAAPPHSPRPPIVSRSQVEAEGARGLRAGDANLKVLGESNASADVPKDDCGVREEAAGEVGTCYGVSSIGRTHDSAASRGVLQAASRARSREPSMTMSHRGVPTQLPRGTTPPTCGCRAKHPGVLPHRPADTDGCRSGYPPMHFSAPPRYPTVAEGYPEVPPRLGARVRRQPTRSPSFSASRSPSPCVRLRRNG